MSFKLNMSTKIWVLASFIFIFSIILRMWNLNGAGRWGDEQWYVEKGQAYLRLIEEGDFKNPFWYLEGADHPPLSTYVYGLASYKDTVSFDKNKVSIFPGMPKGVPNLKYDLTYARMVSVIVTSLAVVLVFLFGARYFSVFTGFSAAIILAMLPHFLGFSQLVDLESWIMLTFTACVFSYLLFLEKNEFKYLLLNGILTGICLQVKQSDILIFIFYFLTYFVWKKTNKKNSIKFSHIFTILFISLVTSVIIYPEAIINLRGYIASNFVLWFKDSGRIPELIFGIHMGARWFYYIIAALITTPLVIILFTLLGLKFSFDNRKKWIFSALLIWFFVPFFMMFFHARQNMVRYIIQFYAPMALLSALGLEYLIGKFTKKDSIKYLGLGLIVLYLMVILVKMTPFYLEYYNELVGGTKNVYEKKLFFLGWFGEGLKDPGIYISKNAKNGAKIGMALNPEDSLYMSDLLSYERYDPKNNYDFIVVSYYKQIRNGFDVDTLNKNYELVYVEKAGGADLARVYKRK